MEKKRRAAKEARVFEKTGGAFKGAYSVGGVTHLVSGGGG